jgi:hypothetical protein
VFLLQASNEKTVLQGWSLCVIKNSFWKFTRSWTLFLVLRELTPREVESGEDKSGGITEKNGGNYVLHYHEAVAGIGCPFWSPDQAVEPQDETLHLWRPKRNLYH